MEDNIEDISRQLKEKGLTCSRLNSMIKKQQRDAKTDRKDSEMFESLGFINEANKQRAIAKAQEESSQKLIALRKKVCRSL